MSDGTETWSFRYDADGLRTEATNGTVTYKYTYSGSSLRLVGKLHRLR